MNHRTHIAVLTQGKRDVSQLLAAVKDLPAELFFYSTTGDATLTQLPPNARQVFTAIDGYVVKRNQALEDALAANARFIVFLDDDEVPGPNWLATLTNYTLQHGCTAVMGRVDAALPPGKVFGNAASFRTPKAPTTGPHTGDLGVGNTIIDLDFVRTHNLRFDMRHNTIGGEDTEFFNRARALGAVLHYSHEAVAVEHVDADRCTLSGRYRYGVSFGDRAVALKSRHAQNLLHKIPTVGINTVRFVRGAVLNDPVTMGDAAQKLGIVVGLVRGRWRR